MPPSITTNEVLRFEVQNVLNSFNQSESPTDNLTPEAVRLLDHELQLGNISTGDRNTRLAEAATSALTGLQFGRLFLLDTGSDPAETVSQLLTLSSQRTPTDDEISAKLIGISRVRENNSQYRPQQKDGTPIGFPKDVRDYTAFARTWGRASGIPYAHKMKFTVGNFATQFLPPALRNMIGGSWNGDLDRLWENFFTSPAEKRVMMARYVMNAWDEMMGVSKNLKEANVPYLYSTFNPAEFSVETLLGGVKGQNSFTGKTTVGEVLGGRAGLIPNLATLLKLYPVETTLAQVVSDINRIQIQPIDVTNPKSNSGWEFGFHEGMGLLEDKAALEQTQRDYQSGHASGAYLNAAQEVYEAAQANGGRLVFADGTNPSTFVALGGSSEVASGALQGLLAGGANVVALARTLAELKISAALFFRRLCSKNNLDAGNPKGAMVLPAGAFIMVAGDMMQPGRVAATIKEVAPGKVTIIDALYADGFRGPLLEASFYGVVKALGDKVDGVVQFLSPSTRKLVAPDQLSFGEAKQGAKIVTVDGEEMGLRKDGARFQGGYYADAQQAKLLISTLFTEIGKRVTTFGAPPAKTYSLMTSPVVRRAERQAGYFGLTFSEVQTVGEKSLLAIIRNHFLDPKNGVAPRPLAEAHRMVNDGAVQTSSSSLNDLTIRALFTSLAPESWRPWVARNIFGAPETQPTRELPPKPSPAAARDVMELSRELGRMSPQQIEDMMYRARHTDVVYKAQTREYRLLEDAARAQAVKANGLRIEGRGFERVEGKK